MSDLIKFKTETLVAFAQVAHLGSFTAAANQLGQTPMAISKKVSTLESLLDESLFERTTRKVVLTQFGEEFMEYSKKILEQHDTLNYWLESRKGKAVGTLKVVAQSPEFYKETIFPWLAEFHKIYPELKLEFDLIDKVIDVNQHKYDIYWGVAGYLGDKHPGLKSRALWNSLYGIFASQEYLDRHGTPMTPDELEGHKVIGYLHNQPDNILLINKTPAVKKETPDYVLLDAPIKTISGQIELALQGMGLINAAPDSSQIRQLLVDKKLIPVLEEYWLSSAKVYLYYHNVKKEQFKIRVFIDFFLSKTDCW